MQDTHLQLLEKNLLLSKKLLECKKNSELLDSKIRHALKNNLQTLMSLIDIKAANLVDPDLRATMNSCMSTFKLLKIILDQEFKDGLLAIEGILSNYCQVLQFEKGLKLGEIDISNDFSLPNDKALKLLILLDTIISHALENKNIENNSISLSVTTVPVEDFHSNNKAEIIIKDLHSRLNFKKDSFFSIITDAISHELDTSINYLDSQVVISLDI